MKRATVLVTLAACSCGKGSDYFPLFPPGTERVYSIRATVPGLLAGNEFRVRFAGDTVIAGNPCTLVITRTPGLPDNPRCVRVSSRGVYELSLSEHQEYALLPPHPKVGEQWPAASGLATLAAIEPLEMGSRRYDKCLKVSIASPAREEGLQYYCRGVGFTKASWTFSGGSVYYELLGSSP